MIVYDIEEKCSYCGSNIICFFNELGELVFECSYCGMVPENSPEIFMEDDEYEEA
jgi:rRNA maturation protein Nop10